MPSPPPTGSGVTSAAASYLAAGGSTAQCSKLVDLSLAYTEILQLQVITSSIRSTISYNHVI